MRTGGQMRQDECSSSSSGTQGKATLEEIQQWLETHSNGWVKDLILPEFTLALTRAEEGTYHKHPLIAAHRDQSIIECIRIDDFLTGDSPPYRIFHQAGAIVMYKGSFVTLEELKVELDTLRLRFLERAQALVTH